MTTKQTATMLVSTTEGLRETKTQVIVSDCARDIVAHVKRGGLTAGFSVTYCVRGFDGAVVRIMKSGYVNQRDIKAMVEAGFHEWHFSWAFSGDNWRLADGNVVRAVRVEKFDPAHIQVWLKAFGY